MNKSAQVLKVILVILAISGTGIIKTFAQDPTVTVRFNNPQWNCNNLTYSLDVEFQCSQAGKELYGMNVLFYYPDDVLEFVSFGGFVSGYGAGYPPPTVQTLSETSGMSLFGFPGAAEYVNGSVVKNSASPITYMSTPSGWTKLFTINFHIDDPEGYNPAFCPPVIWDLNEAGTGGINPNFGIVMTLMVLYPDLTSEAVEDCEQFNWQYDGVPGYPHGTPNPTYCTNTVCAYAPHSILPVMGILNPGAITVPVKVTNFINMGAFNLVFEYDPAVMTYVSNAPNAIFNATNGLLTVTDAASTGGKKKITMSYDGNVISLADSSHLADINFNYSGGSSNLTWKTSQNSCEYICQYNCPAYDQPFSEYYFNGNIVTLDAPKIKLDTLGGYPSDYVTFSVKTWNYLNIHSGSLKLNFDPAVLVYNNALPNPAISNGFTAVTSNPAGTIDLDWVGSDATLANGSELIYLTFQYLGGTSSLSWIDDGTSCQFVNSDHNWVLNDTPAAEHYFNGKISSAPVTWTGEISGDWYTSGNWVNDIAPGINADVTINPPLIAGNFPAFNGDFYLGGDCNSITINDNSKFIINGDFIINPGHSLDIVGNGILEVNGNWVNSGNFDEGQSIVEFTGSGDAVIDEGVPPGNFIASYVCSTFTRGLTSIYSLGANNGPIGDNAQMEVNIGFTFTYLGVNYTSVMINTNGWISLNKSGNATSNDNAALFNTSQPTTVLAPWWDDLITSNTTYVRYKTTGASPSRIFTVEWKDVYSYSTVSTTKLNFQVKLYEGSNAIEFCYKNATPTGIHHTSEGASIGIKDGTGGSGNFLEATQNSNIAIITFLNSATNWPTVNYRFTPPVVEPVETFHKIVVNKSSGNLLIQRDVTITGIE